MPYSQDEYRSTLSEDTSQTPLLTEMDISPTIVESRPIRRLRTVTFDDDLVACSEPKLILDFKLRAPKSEHMIQEEPEVPEPVPVVEEEYTCWKPAAEMLLDLEAKSARLDAYVKGKELHEGDLLQQTMKELKADPTLLTLMEGFSRLWRHVNQIPADGRPQDDIGIMDTSDIVLSGCTVKKSRLEKMMEKSQLKWRKARKDSRTQMKKEGFEFKKAPARSTDPSPGQMHQQMVPDSAFEVVEFVEEPTVAALVPVFSTERYEVSDGEQTSGYSGTVSPAPVLVDESPLSPIPPNDPQEEEAKTAPSEPEDIVKLYSNIPEAIIKTACQINRNVPSVSNYHTVLNFDTIVSSELAVNAITIKDADNLLPLAGLLLKRGSNVSVPNEPIKRARRCSAEVATRESTKSPDDGGYSLVDEISDDEEEIVSWVPTEGGVPWKLSVVSGRLSPTGNHHIHHRLIPVEEDFWERWKTALETEVIPPVAIPLDRRRQEHPFYHLLEPDSKDLPVHKKYTPVPGLTIEDQERFNWVAELDQSERDYAKIIPRWGDIPAKGIVFPTKHPHDGLYWPLFQPIDNVAKDEKILLNADVQNEMVNQTVCHYASRKYLLCDDSPGSWQKDFTDAHSHYKSTDNNRPHEQVRGRFTNRVGYARHIIKNLEQCQRDAKKATEERQEEHQRVIAQQREEQKKAFLERHQLREEDEIPESFDIEYTNVCYSTSLNEQMRAAQRDAFSLTNRYNGITIGMRRRNPFPDYWFSVPRDQYVPANDRRSFLCKYSNYYNEEVIEPIVNMKKVTEDVVDEWVADALAATHDYQYTHDFSRLTEADQTKAKTRLGAIDSSLPRNTVVRLDTLKKFCALAKWEWKYWPLIWDTLSSVYKILPPVSALMPLFEKPVDEAFQNVAKLERRNDYFNKYTTEKNADCQRRRRSANELYDI